MSMEHYTYRLPCHRRFTYGVGHVLNDLCASMWFSYLLVFFHYVVQFSNNIAGYLMLIGQIADAIATPLVGYESDRTNGCLGYTKRKSWHLLGTLCVACSFPFIFSNCIGCANSDEWAQFLYYAAFIVIFQIGWASTQISHLSLIPDLTPNDNERVELNSIRYAFTVISNLFVYVCAWVLFDYTTSGDGGVSKITPENGSDFMKLGLIMVGVGLFFSFLFHIGTKEPESTFSSSLLESLGKLEQEQNDSMKWKDWLVVPQFYMLGVLYMSTRLAVNLSQVYLPMFLTDSLELDAKYIAIIPLVVFMSGFLASFFMRPANAVIGKLLTYVIGSLLVGGACGWMWFLKNSALWEVFGCAVLLGAGTSVILITSLAMTSDLIGPHTSTGAFVFGSMSFTDKFANGLAVMLIQQFHPCKSEACCADCVWYYRDLMVLSPSGAVFMGLVALAILKFMSYKNIGMSEFCNGQSRSPDNNEYKSLIAEDETDVNDCCSFWCCLVTTRDAQARAIACSCLEENCEHKCISNGISNTSGVEGANNQIRHLRRNIQAKGDSESSSGGSSVHGSLPSSPPARTYGTISAS